MVGSDFLLKIYLFLIRGGTPGDLLLLSLLGFLRLVSVNVVGCKAL